MSVYQTLADAAGRKREFTIHDFAPAAGWTLCARTPWGIFAQGPHECRSAFLDRVASNCPATERSPTIACFGVKPESGKVAIWT